MKTYTTSTPGKPDRTDVVMSREELRELDQKQLEANGRIVALRAEITRLRSALTEIATSCDRFHRGRAMLGKGTHAAEIKALAVAALEGQGE